MKPEFIFALLFKENLLILSYFHFFQPKLVTMIPGDGIGPEISASVRKIFQAAGVSAIYKLIANGLS